MSKYKVSEGTQVNYGGTLYAEGETFEADEREVVEEVARGYVEVVESKKGKSKG